MLLANSNIFKYMTVVGQLAIFTFLLLSTIGCNDNRQFTPTQNLAPSDTSFIQEKYNLEIRPSTKIKCDFIVDRPKEKFIKNKLYYVVTSDDAPHNYTLRAVDSPNVRHTYSFLWPCNLPDIVNRGDTILVTGQAYVIYSNEHMRGLPFVIERILIRDNYSRGLNRVFN
jgi:hypothetical protein